VELAGAISEQWDDLRKCRAGAEPDAVTAHAAAPAVAGASSAAELALRERVDTLTVELAARDQRIAQLDATINALLARVTEFEGHPA
jgi:hypothetical protein